MTIDLPGAVRRIKPEKRRTQMRPRPLSALISAASYQVKDAAILLLDTNVYIRGAANNLPLSVASLVEKSIIFHCSVCLSELAAGVGNADPAHPNWSALQKHYNNLFAQVPRERLLTPDPQIWTEAGLIAGTLARTQNFPPHQRKECLNDALIFLTAAKAGLPVLTGNREEFDLIQQLAPHGQFIHY